MCETTFFIGALILLKKKKKKSFHTIRSTRSHAQAKPRHLCMYMLMCTRAMLRLQSNRRDRKFLVYLTKQRTIIFALTFRATQRYHILGIDV
jgi:hypothetical protein